MAPPSPQNDATGWSSRSARSTDACRGATHPEIAAGLFDTEPISKRDWISHELRDRTGRLVRRGVRLMKGGYRQLLVYPYRRHI